MGNIKKGSKPKKREDLLFRELDDGGAIYNPDKEELHTLNSTAAYIWCLSTGDFTIEEIVNQVKEDFESQKNKEKIEEEVESTIKTFKNRNLLVED